MDLETRLELVKREPTQEIVVESELRELLETNAKPGHYIGYEVSGILHVGSLLLAGRKINDLAKAGFKTRVFLADWHSVINNKLGGDWDAILSASKYYEEAFKLVCPSVQIVRGSELYHGNDDYWKDVVKFSKHVTLARATRCMQVLGRSEKETLDVAQYIYPSMQAVDIRHIHADLAHAGMDQRKAHMLARDVFPAMGWKPPIALHHSLLPSLLKPEEGAGRMDSKMSKSKPDSGVFVHDSAEEIRRKINKAYCPAETEGNPVLMLAKAFAFREGKAMDIERPEKFGGDVSFESYAQLETAYAGGKLHAGDLKSGVAAAVDAVVKPVREHFEKRKDLLAVYDKAQITR